MIVKRGVECGSDHLFVKTTVYSNPYQLRKHRGDKKEKSDIVRSFPIEKLREESTCFLYKLRLAQKLKQRIQGNVNDV